MAAAPDIGAEMPSLIVSWAEAAPAVSASRPAQATRVLPICFIAVSLVVVSVFGTEGLGYRAGQMPPETGRIAPVT